MTGACPVHPQSYDRTTWYPRSADTIGHSPKRRVVGDLLGMVWDTERGHTAAATSTGSGGRIGVDSADGIRGTVLAASRVVVGQAGCSLTVSSTGHSEVGPIGFC